MPISRSNRSASASATVEESIFKLVEAAANRGRGRTTAWGGGGGAEAVEEESFGFRERLGSMSGREESIRGKIRNF